MSKSVHTSQSLESLDHEVIAAKSSENLGNQETELYKKVEYSNNSASDIDQSSHVETDIKDFADVTKNKEKDVENATAKKFTESNPGDGTKREDHYLHGTRLITTYMALVLVMLLVSVDQTIAMSILDLLADHFSSPDKVTWIMGAFTLGNGVAVQLWGKMAIIFGRKWTMLTAVIVFEIGSLISGVSQSMDMLIGGRTIQGIGAGGIQGLFVMIIAEIVPINNRSLAMSGYVSIVGVSAVLGPFIGGGLATVSWRWCFYINLPIAAVAAIVFVILFRPPPPVGNKWEKVKQIDYIDSLLFASSVAIFLVGLTLGGGEYPWNSAAVISCVVIGGIIFFVFVYWNCKVSKAPLFPNQILSSLPVQLSFLGIFFGGSVSVVVIQFISLYFEIVRNRSPFQTGVELLPVLVPLILTSVILGIVINKTRLLKPFAILGAVLTTLSTGLLVLFKADSSMGLRIGICIVFGVGSGLVFQPMTMNAQLHAPKAAGSTIMAMSYLVVARNIGTSVMSAMGEIAYISRITSTLSNSDVFLASGYTAHDILNDSSVANHLNETQSAVVIDAFMNGIHAAFYFTIGISSVFLVVSLLISNKRIPKKEDVKQK